MQNLEYANDYSCLGYLNSFIGTSSLTNAAVATCNTATQVTTAASQDTAPIIEDLISDMTEYIQQVASGSTHQL